MFKFQKSSSLSRNAQTAVEYLLLLAAVVAVTLVSFKTLLPKVSTNTQLFYNKAASGILGAAPRCGDGFCNRNMVAGKQVEDVDTCCIDCGSC